MEDKEFIEQQTCSKCGKPTVGKWECPYAFEISDETVICDCCNDCRDDCSMDI